MAMDEEGVQKTLGELLAANKATQANLDKIAQQFPIQPPNLADAIPTFTDLEEGGLTLPSPTEAEPGQVLVIGEGGMPEWGVAGGSSKSGWVKVEWGNKGKSSDNTQVIHNLGTLPKRIMLTVSAANPETGKFHSLIMAWAEVNSFTSKELWLGLESPEIHEVGAYAWVFWEVE